MGCVKYLYMKVSKNLTIDIASGYISCTNIAQAITLHQKNKLNMKKLYLTLILMQGLQANAQEQWSVWQCMDYAVEHNHNVRKSTLTLDSYKAEKLSAIGSFLPNIGANIGAQYNFGRAIDPETNTYTDVSTFNNSYSLSTSLPIFDGFSRIHSLRAAKADVLMGKNNLQQQKDQTALAVFQAFINVLYYKGTVKMAGEKLQESILTLKQTRIMEEIGRKSPADVAQIEAQLAADEYLITQQQNNLHLAMLSLKKEMNYPLADTLILSENHSLTTEDKNIAEISANGISNNPELQQSYYAQRSALHQLRRTRSALFPSLSVNAGIGTNYYKTLHSENTQSFNQQFKNNRGEYVGASISIPLFNRLNTIASIRRAKNNYKIACENYEQKTVELQKLLKEAELDYYGSIKETKQLEKKAASDSIAYSLIKHQYNEGLSTAIDLQTSASTLLKTRADLAKSRLTIALKHQLIRYYTAL